MTLSKQEAFVPFQTPESIKMGLLNKSKTNQNEFTFILAHSKLFWKCCMVQERSLERESISSKVKLMEERE